MNFRLCLPASEHEATYRSYITELGDENRIPFPLDFDHSDFKAWLERVEGISKGIGVPEGYVSSTTFFLMDGDELIGVSNLRHYLNDLIREHGGHIGLGVRPSNRGQGIGNQLMAMTIEEARKRGIDEIHIHCLKDNLASANTIRRNGGQLQSEGVVDGENLQRFVVAVLPSNPRHPAT